MNDKSPDYAKNILHHYITMLMERANIKADSDTRAELDGMIDNIINVCRHDTRALIAQERNETDRKIQAAIDNIILDEAAPPEEERPFNPLEEGLNKIIRDAQAERKERQQTKQEEKHREEKTAMATMIQEKSAEIRALKEKHRIERNGYEQTIKTIYQAGKAAEASRELDKNDPMRGPKAHFQAYAEETATESRARINERCSIEPDTYRLQTDIYIRARLELDELPTLADLLLKDLEQLLQLHADAVTVSENAMLTLAPPHRKV